MKHILPRQSEAELWDTLALRCPKPDAVADLLGTNEAKELLEDRDLAEDLPEDALPSASPEKLAYTDEYRRTKPRTPAGKAKGKRGGPRPKTRATTPTLTEGELQAMLPEPARCWRDQWNQRWQLAYKGARIGSISFGLYGYTEAAQLIAKLAWDHHVLHGGVAPSDPVVRDFIGAPSAPGGARAPVAKAASASSSGR